MASVDSLDQARVLRDQLLKQGKLILTQRNPNEFAYYMVALELLKSDLSTSKYFIFPVNPNAIEYNDTSLTKITKTAGGISVLKTSQFNIRDITLSGNFGLNFKVLTGTFFQSLVGAFKDENNPDKNAKAVLGGVLDGFSSVIKTGYGCTKVVEDILESSLQKDEYGGSHFLVFYNLAFNQKFLVEYESKSFNQSLESNMIWNYSIRLKAIGKADDFLKSKDEVRSNKQLMVNNFIQKTANNTFSQVNDLLQKNYNSVTEKYF